MNWNHFSFSHGSRYVRQTIALDIYIVPLFIVWHEHSEALLLCPMIIFLNFFFFFLLLLLLYVVCICFSHLEWIRCRMQRMWWQLNKCDGKAIENDIHYTHTHTHHPYSYIARVIFRFFPFFSFVCVCFFHSFFHVDRVDHLSSVWNIYYIYGRHMYTEHCTTLYNSV